MKQETLKLKIVAHMKNGDCWAAPWVRYTVDEADSVLTTIKKIKHLDHLKLTLANGDRIYINPDDISTVEAKIRRSFWSLPLFRSLK